MKKIICILINILVLWSCRKAQDIDLILPAYDGKLMVECYLQPGQTYKMLLTESVPYLEYAIAKPVNNALVTITYNGKTDTLSYTNRIIDSEDTTKIYNYTNPKVRVPKDYKGKFELYIRAVDGRVATAATTIAPKATIDSAYVSLDNQNRSLYAYIADLQTDLKYYRFMVFQEDNMGIQTQSTITDNKQIKLSPYIFNTPTQLVFKSKGDFFDTPKGIIDSVALRAIAINKDYYDFLVSIRNAQDANGNPFAQPASIRNNITGGSGIFTGFDPAKIRLKVPK